MSRPPIGPDARVALARPVGFVRLVLPASVVGRLLVAPFLLAATVLAAYVLGAFVLAVLDAVSGWRPAKVDDGGYGADDAWILGSGIVVGAGGWVLAVLASSALRGRRTVTSGTGRSRASR
jgi:hypothetical protein